MLAENACCDKLILQPISINFLHMNKLGWHHFRMLATIRSTGSLSAAARTLGLTQSAATHQVKEAERRLGVSLLARRGRSVTLTPAGGILADAAAVCAPLLTEAEAKAQELGHGDAPRLRLAVGLQDGLAWPATCSPPWRRADPIRLDVISRRKAAGAAAAPGRSRRRRRTRRHRLRGLKRELIAEDELVCIVSPGHPFPRGGRRRPPTSAITYFAHALTPQRGFEFEAFFRPARQVPAYIARMNPSPPSSRSSPPAPGSASSRALPSSRRSHRERSWRCRSHPTRSICRVSPHASVGARHPWRPPDRGDR